MVIIKHGGHLIFLKLSFKSCIFNLSRVRLMLTFDKLKFLYIKIFFFSIDLHIWYQLLDNIEFLIIVKLIKTDNFHVLNV
jgi:hypothetical protein